MNKLYINRHDVENIVKTILNIPPQEYLNINECYGIKSYYLNFYKKNNYISELINIYPKDICNIILSYFFNNIKLECKISLPYHNKNNDLFFIQIIIENTKYSDMKLSSVVFLMIYKDHIQFEIMDCNTLLNKYKKDDNNIFKLVKFTGNYTYYTISPFLNVYLKSVYNKKYYNSKSIVFDCKKNNKDEYTYEKFHHLTIKILDHVHLKYLIIITKLIINSLEKRLNNINLYDYFYKQLKSTNKINSEVTKN